MKKEISHEAIAEMKRLQKMADKKGLTKYRIAQMTGLQESTISRVFAGKYVPKLDTYLNIKAAIEQ